MEEFEVNNISLLSLIEKWEPKLQALPENVITHRKNSQSRTIRQILGHMVDSASNNTHRIIHLQYRASPLIFPDYANVGNNDRWIAIQNYQTEDWNNVIQLWKYTNIHIVHVIRNVNPDKLGNEWISALGDKVSLKDMIMDYLHHFELHLSEIDELISQN
ncbi:hypothetical protein [Prevotella sp. 10(H)]|uniref:hypothetical protein n=1 Tax=Prevotella sp. 10(H) TaxID=1158294 RepID=UPI0004A7704F|nr:hypothetical protein [Prevotella sp. 10(H)]